MGDRIVHWKQHGDSYLCEKHYQEYRKRFRHLIGSAEQIKPDDRFSDSRKQQAEATMQLEL
jgi:hypothetical protein